MCRCDSTCGHSCLCSCHPWDRTATGSPTPTTAEALAANIEARLAFNAKPDPTTRVLDDLGREWALKRNGTWAVLGDAVTVDSFVELAAKYGVMGVLS